MDKEKKSTEKKVFDVASPKKVSPSPTTRPLVVTNRPVIKRDPMMAETAPEVPEKVAVAVTSSSTKKVIAVPVSEPAEAAPEPAAEDKPEPEAAAAPAEAPTPEPEEAAATEPTEEKTPEPPAAPADEPADEPDEDTGDAGVPSPDAEAEKAAEEAAKRQAEWDKYISSREFFVPVDTVQRKRSIRTSLWLTLLIAFLAIVLIDLMLDSGFIELIQKIPHTHFFS